MDTIEIDTTRSAADLAAQIIDYYTSFITWGEGEYAHPNTHCVRCCPLGVLAHAVSPAFWERRSYSGSTSGAAVEALRHVYVDGESISGTDFSLGLFYGNDNHDLAKLADVNYHRQLTPALRLGHEVGQLVRRWALTGIGPHEVVLSWSPYE